MTVPSSRMQSRRRSTNRATVHIGLEGTSLHGISAMYVRNDAAYMVNNM